MQFSRNMTIIRDGDTLTLVNSLRLDEEGLARLDELGSVESIVKLGSFHGRDDAFYIDRYGAKLWAPSGMEHERGVKTDALLLPDQKGPCADASVFVYETATTPEALLLLARHGGLLLACDSLQNWSGADQYFDEAAAAMMRANGFFHPANVGPGWRNAANPQASDFARLKKLEFRHLISAHGDPLLNEAHQAVSATINKLFEL
ncbi:MAG: hypothetical protein GY789_10260 [Hyphomicrobiales bacterium]|nr:hypothetical protein [Hyphomicrobiales bacterium]MCP5001808.1 hypothetical protein [Hyphomicrobiales bacterium]